MIHTDPDHKIVSAVSKVIHDRRTINFFKQESPPRELILNAVEAARWAPNHHLTEPWRFYLLSDQAKQTIVDLNAEKVASSKGRDAGEAKRKRWSSIPGWMVVTCTSSENELRAREDYAACCCAIYAMTLYLWPHGVGVKWTTGDVIRDSRFYDAIWTDPDAEQVVGLIWYGYPAETPVAARKPLSEIVVEI